MARNAGLRPTPRGRAGAGGEKGRAAGRERRARPSGGSSGRAGASRAAARPSRAPKAPSVASRRRAAAPRPQAPAERRQRHQRARAARVALLAVGALAALAVVALVALFALRDSSLFRISSVEFEPTEHISADDVQNLARVPVDATLLNVDTSAIEAELKKNPWVGSVSFERVFPNTLRIAIQEQVPDLLVVMSSGSVGWYLGDAGTWIEPVPIQAAEGQSVNDAALAIAQEKGCVLVTDVPSTVDPAAGSAATDEVLDAVRQFREGFSDDFASQVVCYSAPSVENISCVLASGVEVSLGSADEIATKQAIVESYLEQYPGSVVLINVRVTSAPSFREVASDHLQAGEGVSVSSGSSDGGQAAGDGSGSSGSSGDGSSGDSAAADGSGDGADGSSDAADGA